MLFIAAAYNSSTLAVLLLVLLFPESAECYESWHLVFHTWCLLGWIWK